MPVMTRSRTRGILGVDDDRLVRMNARLVLEREGWTVDEAADCGSAIAFLETRDYDLVVWAALSTARLARLCD